MLTPTLVRIGLTAHRLGVLGRNDLGQPLYDSNSGGCSDGLHQDRVSENQGAESTLAFHLSLAEMNFAEHLIPQPLSFN